MINTERDAAHALRVDTASQRYTLDAVKLDDNSVRLNGHTLELGANDELPEITAVQTPAGTLTFAPATVTFLAMPAAANGACQPRR